MKMDPLHAMKIGQPIIWVIAFLVAFASVQFGLYWWRERESERGIRSLFMKSVSATCLQVRNNSTPTEVGKFCDCFAQKMTDSFSIAEMKVLLKRDAAPSAMKEEIEAAQKACAPIGAPATP